MKKLSILFKAVKIEWHWWFIRKERKKGNSLITDGYSLSSSKMLQLNKRLSRHSTKVLKAQREYREMVGTTKNEACPPNSLVTPLPNVINQ